MIKKAIVFAAGKGTRLKPITDHIPKALAEVGGEPMLKRVILKLKDAGIEEIVVNVHHFARQIKDYIHANDRFGVKIHISDESELLLDTGGGILKAAGWLEDGKAPFLVHNSDILTDFDLQSMSLDHIAHQRDITLLCDKRETTRHLLFDDKMRMHGWCNTLTGQIRPPMPEMAKDFCMYAFGGVHLMQPSVIGRLREYCNKRALTNGCDPARMPFSIMDFFIEYCCLLNIGGYRPSTPYMWHDIGKPESLKRADDFFRLKGGI